MPEGDSLRRAEAALAPLLVGKALIDAYDHGLRRRSLAGAVVESVEAHGKNLVITLSTGVSVRVHLGIAGAFRRVEGADEMTLRRATLALVTDDAAYLAVKAKAAEWIRTAFVAGHAPLAKLGPDLLRPPIAFDAVIKRARQVDSATPVGVVLLDQRVAAGIGNVYKSEVCFLERVDPFVAIASIDDATIARLYRRAADLLATNLGDWPRTTTADISRGERPPRGQGRYFVYGRARRACYVCRGILESRAQGDAVRRTFFCRRCQAVAVP